MRPPSVRPLFPLVLLSVLTACGTAQQATLPQSPSSSGPAAQPGPTRTAEVEVDRGGMEPAVVTNVRYAAHDTYDRLVVDLRGGIPGYDVKWVDGFVQDGSGKPIDVRGGAYLQLTLFPAHAHDDEGEPTWGGGPVYAAGLGNLTKVVRTGDFEGRVGIGLALDRRAGFRVTEQGSPDRLVLDVAH
ncbi:AMIN-like domain-containing (lipo)protein [Nonomuraea salmonea]|uniref:AMIN-like domain-containing protein n=1 Tax=Nonomuraea salmonea TaxID=46181 RepID=A0ABV5NF30_9ACTN